MTVLRAMFRSSSGTANVALVALIISAVSARISAEDPLRFVPASSATVIVFRDLNATCKNINQYLTRNFPESQQLEPRDIEAGFDLPPGTVEFSKPVLLIGTLGGFETEDMIVGFTPKQDGPLTPLAHGPDGAVKACPGTDSDHFVMPREGFAFVSGSRKALRMLKIGSFRRSLGDALDGPQRGLLTQNDIFVRISMDRWRDKINPWIALMSGAISAGMAQNSTNSQTAESAEMLTWFSDGARAVLDQMRTISIGLSFDGQVFRMRHIHTFMPGESTASYLNKIRRNNIDFASLMPDRRFIMMIMCNWETPGDNSLSYRMLQQALKAESVTRRLNPEQREKLLAVSHDCYGQTSGSYFVLGTPEGRRGPMQVFGGDIMRDSASGIKHMKYIQENAADLVSAFLPGAGYGNSKLTEKDCKGKKYLEMAFAGGNLDKEFLRGVEAIYGPDPAFQMAVASPTDLVFSVCGRQSPQGVCSYLTRSDGNKRINSNDQVTGFIKKMTPDANVVCVFNADAMFDSLPVFMKAALEKQGRGPPPHVENKTDRRGDGGVLIGWSGKVQKNAFTGELIIESDKIPALVASAKRVAVEIHQTVGGAQPPMPPEPAYPPRAPRAP